MQTTDEDIQLAQIMASCYSDPLRFVTFAFPWGEAGPLSDLRPRKWQAEFLRQISDEVISRRFNGRDAVAPIQFATASGHGIGKSAITAWIILWLMSTRPDAKGIVTANTSDQLRTKTWSELGKWYNMCVTKRWFKYSSGKGSMSLVSLERPETWRVDAQTCREENSESFAGLHAANSSPFYIFDEASAVPDPIWEVSDGGLTDGEPHRYVFGNPTKNSGRFFRCFGVDRHRWRWQRIDSRDVEGTNKELFAGMVEDHGEDSDYVRVRVRGLHPRGGSVNFIGQGRVDDAMARELPPEAYQHAPRVLGVDVARHGDDRSAICLRQGAKLHWIEPYRIDDLMRLASIVAEFIRDESPEAVFIDAGGMGAGVYDRLRQLGHEVVPVQFGEKAHKEHEYTNKRTEIWGEMRKWLDIADLTAATKELSEDLTGPEYSHDLKERLVLERKKDMKKRGLDSPDLADALAVTFAQPVSTASDNNWGWVRPKRLR